MERVAGTVCAYCGVGCKFDVVKGQLKGRKGYPANNGAACAKGLSQPESITARRWTNPQVRHAGQWRRTNYAEAIAQIAEAIQVTDPKRVGFYLSGQMLNEDYYVANKLAKGFIGTPNCDTNSRTCMASAVVGYKRAFGVDYVPVRMEDIEQAEVLILIGANPSEAHVVLSRRIKRAQKQGLKVLVIDPRETETAQMADHHITIRPGGDIDLLNALAKRLIETDRIDADFVRDHAEGFEAYRDALSGMDEEALIRAADVSMEDFEMLAALWHDHTRIITAWTMGINQSAQGTDANNAIINLHILTGQIGRPGSGPFSLTGQPNAMGGREVGGLSTTLAVHRDYDEESRRIVGEFWASDRIPKEGGLTAFEMIEQAHVGGLDVLIVCHTDPVYHLPNRHFVEEAFKKIPLVVEINAYTGSETSTFAHIRLPAKAFGEKEGTQTNLDRTVTRVEAFAQNDARLQDWEIFAMLGRALGHEEAFDYADTRAVFEEYQAMTRLSPKGHLDLYRADYDSLKSEPYVWGEGLLEAGHFLTKSGRAQLIVIDNKNHSEQPSSAYPFVLLTGRTRDQWHSGSKTAHLPKLLRHKPLQFVEIHRDDAQTYDLNEGDWITIRSQWGQIKAPVRFASIRRGTLFVPISHREINYLTPPTIDPLSKEPDYNHTAVAISPC